MATFVQVRVQVSRSTDPAAHFIRKFVLGASARGAARKRLKGHPRAARFCILPGIEAARSPPTLRRRSRADDPFDDHLTTKPPETHSRTAIRRWRAITGLTCEKQACNHALSRAPNC